MSDAVLLAVEFPLSSPRSNVCAVVFPVLFDQCNLRHVGRMRKGRDVSVRWAPQWPLSLMVFNSGHTSDCDETTGEVGAWEEHRTVLHYVSIWCLGVQPIGTTGGSREGRSGFCSLAPLSSSRPGGRFFASLCSTSFRTPRCSIVCRCFCLSLSHVVCRAGLCPFLIHQIMPLVPTKTAITATSQVRFKVKTGRVSKAAMMHHVFV